MVFESWNGRYVSNSTPIVNKICHMEYRRAFHQYVRWKTSELKLRGRNNPRVSSKPASHLPGEARPFAKRIRPGFPPRHDGATIKRQKVLAVALFAHLRFRPPCCSGNARSIESQKRSSARRLRRFCAARTIANAAQLRPDVLTVFPNTLLRFYAGEGDGARGLAVVSVSLGYD